MCVIRELLLKEKRKATRIKEGGGMMGNMNLILTGVRTGGGDQALNNNKKKNLLFFFALLSSLSCFSTLPFYSPFVLSFSTRVGIAMLASLARNNFFSFLLLFFRFFLWQKKRRTSPSGIAGERRWGSSSFITTAGGGASSLSESKKGREGRLAMLSLGLCVL